MRFCFVAGAFPWPVRSVEVEAEQKRTVGLRIIRDRRDGAVPEKVREVTGLMDLHVVFPEIVGVARRDAGFVGEVIEPAATKTPEVLVSTFQRAEVREPTQMPFSNQRGAIAGLLQKGRQCRMFGW